MNKYIIILTILFLILNLNSCSKKSKDDTEVILAQIGDKTIELNEFIYRAEYTIRPPYCQDNNNIHKKIVLNSLIAEKMLALEAGPENDLAKNERFQRYIQGRKEQAMRQWLYQKEIYDQVKLEPAAINKAYQVAGRKYKINYFSLPNNSVAEQVSKRLNEQGESFEEIYFEITGTDSIPEREVDFQMPEHPAIHDALFSDTLKVNQVIGPILTEDNLYIVMKVKGWTTTLAISERDQKQRWDDASENLTQREAGKIYEEYVHKIMKGKTIEFSRDAFNEMVKVFAPIYFSSPQEKRELLMRGVFNNDSNDSISIYEELDRSLKDNQNRPFFKIDDKVYTVEDFERELEIHPLVFRKQKFKSSEFAEQFKLAIVDMVRDKYITQAAYKKGYDNALAVERVESMWKDALMAQYQKYKYLKQINADSLNEIQMIDRYLNPYVDELQKKYNDVIKIDVQHFNDIELTRIDMFTIQKNVPFPIIVPSFPQVTTDPWLNYGRKM